MLADTCGLLLPWARSTGQVQRCIICNIMWKCSHWSKAGTGIHCCNRNGAITLGGSRTRTLSSDTMQNFSHHTWIGPLSGGSNFPIPPSVNTPLGFIYIKAKTKAIFFFDLCHCCCHCSINTHIGNYVSQLRAGGPVIPGLTSSGQSWTQSEHVPGCYGYPGYHGDEYYFYFMGGHTQASPKGGRSCSLSTRNY